MSCGVHVTHMQCLFSREELRNLKVLAQTGVFSYCDQLSAHVVGGLHDVTRRQILLKALSHD